jgi:hypothetical protein
MNESPDTRLDCAIGDVKCASAALDDARTKLAELLEGRLPWPDRDVVALDNLKSSINLVLDKSDSIIGSLTRVLERLPNS